MSATELTKLIKEAQTKFRGELPKREIAQAVFDVYCHKYGFDGCLDEVLPDRPNNYWTRERCLASAKKFSSRTKWQQTESGSYHAARKHGWIDECTAHMKPDQRPNGYWTLERCKESALKFKSRKEWYRRETVSYGKAQRKGWLDECCTHMPKRAKS